MPDNTTLYVEGRSQTAGRPGKELAAVLATNFGDDRRSDAADRDGVLADHGERTEDAAENESLRLRCTVHNRRRLRGELRSTGYATSAARGDAHHHSSAISSTKSSVGLAFCLRAMRHCRGTATSIDLRSRCCAIRLS